jgi:hypothetical protein
MIEILNIGQFGLFTLLSIAFIVFGSVLYKCGFFKYGKNER